MRARCGFQSYGRAPRTPRPFPSPRARRAMRRRACLPGRRGRRGTASPRWRGRARAAGCTTASPRGSVWPTTVSGSSPSLPDATHAATRASVSSPRGRRRAESTSKVGARRALRAADCRRGARLRRPRRRPARSGRRPRADAPPPVELAVVCVSPTGCTSSGLFGAPHAVARRDCCAGAHRLPRAHRHARDRHDGQRYATPRPVLGEELASSKAIYIPRGEHGEIRSRRDDRRCRARPWSGPRWWSGWSTGTRRSRS